MRIRSVLLVALSGLAVELGAPALLRAQEHTAIFVMKADGSQLRRLADVDGYRLHGSPRWSHDGQRLAFDAASAADVARHWFVVNADGGGLTEMGLGAYADWSPDDKQLVVAVDKNAPVKKGIWVHNVDGRGRQWLADGGAARWSPDGGGLAAINGTELEILDLVDSGRRKLEVSGEILPGFDWSPNGKQLAFVMNRDGQKELWTVDVADANTKKKLLSGNLDAFVAWSPDGKRLAIAIDGRIQLLGVDGAGAPVPIPGQEGSSRMPAWSPDGKWLAFSSDRTSPALAPVMPTRLALSLEEVKRHTRGNVVYGLTLSLDGRLALLGGKKDLEVWNLADDLTNRLDLRGEWVTLSPDGRTVALCGPLVKIALGDFETGKPIRDLHTGSMCTNVEFSRDGKQLVCGTIDKLALVWDVASGKRICAFEEHNAPITRVAFMPSGEEAASNGQDKMLRIWNAETAKQRLAIPHPEVVWGLAVSPDGRLIATGTGGATVGNPIIQRITQVEDNSVRLWDAASGQLVREMKGHTNIAYVLAFSPDGRTLVSGGWDGAIRLWDVSTGRQLASVQGQGSVYALAFTPDGSELVVGGGENRSANANIARYRDEQVRLYRIVPASAETPAASE